MMVEEQQVEGLRNVLAEEAGKIVVVPAAKMMHATVATAYKLPQLLLGFRGAVSAAAFDGAAVYGEFFHSMRA